MEPYIMTKLSKVLDAIAEVLLVLFIAAMMVVVIVGMWKGLCI
ncbi:TRAP-type C4-dicarboxylate transport system permease small subunit [Virgibacillus halotolerans]|nr:TRAP-type C4-dicarboxylate transport system permease small subunit [Virgibacillus halotolerans]